MHKPFMGVNTPEDDGPIFVQTMNAGSEGKLVSGLGNSDMQNFKTNDSAMDALNSQSIQAEYGLGNGPSTSTSYGTPTPATRVAPMKTRKMGQLNVKSGEFWGLVGLAFASGVLGKHLFDTYVK
jgi:hypothetical protein